MEAYLFNTFQENINALEKMQELLENTLINLEYTVLTESENSLTVVEQKKTWKDYLKKALDFLINLWEKITKILGEAVKRIAGSNIYYVMTKDVEIGKYTMDKFPEAICNKIINATGDESDDMINQLEEKMDDYISESLNNKYTLSEGSKVDVVAYLKNRKSNDKFIKSLEKKSTGTDFNPKLSKLYTKLIKFLTIIGKDSSLVISNCKLFKKADAVTIVDKDGKEIARESRTISKHDKEKYRNYNKVHGINNESVTRNEFIASIMLEAAELLKNDNKVLNEASNEMNNKLFQNIFDKLQNYLPDGWKKVKFHAIYSEGSYEMKYFVDTGNGKYKDCFNLGFSKDKLIKLFMSIDKQIKPERNKLKNKWKSMTLTVTLEGKMKTNFSY